MSNLTATTVGMIVDKAEIEFRKPPMWPEDKIAAALKAFVAGMIVYAKGRSYDADVRLLEEYRDRRWP